MWLSLGLIWVTCWAYAGMRYQQNLQAKQHLEEELAHEWREIDFR